MLIAVAVSRESIENGITNVHMIIQVSTFNKWSSSNHKTMGVQSSNSAESWLVKALNSVTFWHLIVCFRLQVLPLGCNSRDRITAWLCPFMHPFIILVVVYIEKKGIFYFLMAPKYTATSTLAMATTTAAYIIILVELRLTCNPL